MKRPDERGIAAARRSALAVALAALAVGCGAHSTEVATTTHLGSKPANAGQSGLATRSKQGHAKSEATALYAGTCPKVIAANCVAGRVYGGPGVICTGHGNPRPARTITPADIRRTARKAAKNEAEYRKTGKLPRAVAAQLANPPTQITLQMLPNGNARGICEWGRNPALSVTRNAANY